MRYGWGVRGGGTKKHAKEGADMGKNELFLDLS